MHHPVVMSGCAAQTGSPFHFEQSGKQANYHSIEAGAAQLCQFCHGLLVGFRRSESAVARHVHVSIADGDDAAVQRYILALESEWVAAAVEGFVMGFDSLGHTLDLRDRA